jgi:DNA replication protein DnaC
MKPTFDKCDNCGLRPKAVQGGTQRDWCKVCIDRYRRALEEEKSLASRIYKVVEPLYAEAVVGDLEDIVVGSVLSRPENQDVYFYGAPGVGKTHAIAAFIRHYMTLGWECERINFDDFCCQVRSTMSRASKKTEWDMIEPIKNVDMLVIDDLGLRTKAESDFAYTLLYAILNKRQERLLPTFISSNKNLDELRKSFDQRIISRLIGSLQIEIKGEDRRKQVI